MKISFHGLIILCGSAIKLFDFFFVTDECENNEKGNETMIIEKLHDPKLHGPYNYL